MFYGVFTALHGATFALFRSYCYFLFLHLICLIKSLFWSFWHAAFSLGEKYSRLFLPNYRRIVRNWLLARFRRSFSNNFTSRSRSLNLNNASELQLLCNDVPLCLVRSKFPSPKSTVRRRSKTFLQSKFNFFLFSYSTHAFTYQARHWIRNLCMCSAERKTGWQLTYQCITTCALLWFLHARKSDTCAFNDRKNAPKLRRFL